MVEANADAGDPISWIFSGVFTGIEAGYSFFKGRALYDSANRMRGTILALFHQVDSTQSILRFVDMTMAEFHKKVPAYKLRADVTKALTEFTNDSKKSLQSHTKSLRDSDEMMGTTSKTVEQYLAGATASEVALTVTAGAAKVVAKQAAAKAIPILGPIYAGSKMIHTIVAAPDSVYDSAEASQVQQQAAEVARAECSILRGLINMLQTESAAATVMDLKFGLKSMEVMYMQVWGCRCFSKEWSRECPHGYSLADCRKQNKKCSPLAWGRTTDQTVAAVTKLKAEATKGGRAIILTSGATRWLKAGMLLLPPMHGYRLMLREVKCVIQDDTIGLDEAYLMMNEEHKHVLGDYKDGTTTKFMEDVSPYAEGFPFLVPGSNVRMVLFDYERIGSDDELGSIAFYLEHTSGAMSVVTEGADGATVVLRTPPGKMEELMVKFTDRKTHYELTFKIELVKQQPEPDERAVRRMYKHA